MDEGEQLELVRHPTADDDTLRGEDADIDRQGIGNIGGFQVPGGMVRREHLSRLPPAFVQRWTSGQPLKTIPVERADTRERIPLVVMRDGNVPHLRVDQDRRTVVWGRGV